jgi:hypothetical protein
MSTSGDVWLVAGFARRRILAGGSGILVLLAAVPGWAQQPATVGNLLDQGGRRLTKDEIIRLYTGATVTGSQVGKAATRFRTTYNADGSANGSAVWPGGSTTVTGSWSIDAAGQVCNDLTNSFGGKVQGCLPYFVLDGTYYSARMTDRTEPIYERQFTR